MFRLIAETLAYGVTWLTLTFVYAQGEKGVIELAWLVEVMLGVGIATFVCLFATHVELCFRHYNRVVQKHRF